MTDDPEGRIRLETDDLKVIDQVGCARGDDDPYRDDLEALVHRDVWLSRLMFNMFVGWPPETRSFDEYLHDQHLHDQHRTGTL